MVPDRITTVDPDPGTNKLPRRRIAVTGIEVAQHTLGGEQLPFEGETFDCVASTWTLCSIPGAEEAIGEVSRGLRPGGRFVFPEHGLSDDAAIQKWQRRLDPTDGILGDRCRLDLDMPSLPASQPLADLEVERFPREEVPRTHGTMYRGAATK